MDKYLVSPNPHVHAAVSSDSLMRDVIIALLPAIVVSVVFYGWSELLVLAVGALSCVLLEYVIARWLMKDIRLFSGSSALVTGLLLSMNLVSEALARTSSIRPSPAVYSSSFPSRPI